MSGSGREVQGSRWQRKNFIRQNRRTSLGAGKGGGNVFMVFCSVGG